MSRTLTAMFNTREDAEAGRQRLLAANIDADNVRIHDQSSQGYDADNYSSATHSGSGLWGSVKNAMLPDEDRHTYEEGIRRGGYVLTADVDEDEVDDAVRALEETSSIDIDERSQSWRNEGWQAPAAGMAATGTAAGYDRDRTTDTTTNSALGFDNDRDRDAQKLDVIEERLVVGKREVERGGVRVRSYVTEKPVHEQVRLREEHVNVERRPVDRRVDGVPADAFQDRTIELTERAEEAVVGKEARVVEEVVVSKTAEERVQDINETVRRTDVDVDQLGSDTTRSAIGGTSMTGPNTYGDRDNETLGEKARDAVESVKDGLGIGNDRDRNRGAGEY